MNRSIKDHPFYPRLVVVPAAEAASWVLGAIPIEEANKKDRMAAFRCIGKRIMGGREERTKYGFNSDTNGEIARAMEWAFQAGQRSVQHGGSK